MIYLILSILCSSLIYALFKSFERYGVDTFPAIVINYYMAAIFGFVYLGDMSTTAASIFEAKWLPWAALVGFLFITLFYIIAAVSQQFGVTVASIASKMSLIIPVAILLAIDPSEGAGITKIIGILVGLLAVFLASDKGRAQRAANAKLILPIVLFVGSGGLDFILAIVQKTFLHTPLDYKLFVPVPFAFAAILGTVVLVIRSKQKIATNHKRNLLGGLVLGLVNYGSIYFLLRAIGSSLLDRSSAIPANNIGIVLLSTLIGIVLYKERLSAKNAAGVALAVLSILLLTYLA